MKWLPGRQGKGYEKLPLLVTKKFDCYILRMKPGSSVDVHCDSNGNGRHYRMNVLLKKAQRGGEFHGRHLFKLPRVIIFRPDETWHWVTEVEKGTRYVLSIGWLRK